MKIRETGGGPINNKEATSKKEYDTNIVYKESWYPNKTLKADIIGLHPSIKYPQIDSSIPKGEHLTNLLARTPIIEIYPAMPKFGSASGGGGMGLLNLDTKEGKSVWYEILKSLTKLFGETLQPNTPLVVAAQADSLQIGESFSNSYGQTMFEGLFSAESQLGANLARVMGIQDVSDVANSINNTPLAGPYKSTMEKLAQMFPGIANGNNSTVKNVSSAAGYIAPYAKAAMNLLLGARVDYPSIWQGSNFSAQYQFTIRLYCIDMNDYDEYVESIVKPIAYILALTVPVTTVTTNEPDPYTFSFPLMIKAKCGGLFYVPAGFISNVQINKGGPTNDIAYQQQPGIVDVSITVDSLYDTMVAYRVKGDANVNEDADRPTLTKYIASMIDWIEYGDLYHPKAREAAEKPPAESKEVPVKGSKFGQSLKSAVKDITNAINSVNESIQSGMSQVMSVVSKASYAVSSPLSLIGESTTSITGSISGLTDTLGASVAFFDAVSLGKLNLNEKLGDALFKVNMINANAFQIGERLTNMSSALASLENISNSDLSFLNKISIMTSTFRDIPFNVDVLKINYQNMGVAAGELRNLINSNFNSGEGRDRISEFNRAVQNANELQARLFIMQSSLKGDNMTSLMSDAAELSRTLASGDYLGFLVDLENMCVSGKFTENLNALFGSANAILDVYESIMKSKK